MPAVTTKVHPSRSLYAVMAPVLELVRNAEQPETA